MANNIKRNDLLQIIIERLPQGWMLMKHYAEKHDVRYNVIFQRAMNAKIPYQRHMGHIIVPADMPAEQFRHALRNNGRWGKKKSPAPKAGDLAFGGMAL